MTISTVLAESLKRALIVFVKAPIPGDVKTRLIPFLTSAEAADLYKCFVTDVLRNSLQLSSVAKVQVAYQSHPKAADLSWVGIKSAPDFFKQDGRILGERLVHAFGIAFGKGAKQVIIIGSDSPNLPKDYLEKAFAALEEADVVLGPSSNGGYYLVGLSRPCLTLFEDVIWSTDQVVERIGQNAAKAGYALRILPPHYGIDTIDDLKMLYQQLLRHNQHAPTTTKYLDQLFKAKALFSVA